MKESRKKIIGIGRHPAFSVHLPKHSRAGLEHSNTSTGLDPASAFFHSGNGLTGCESGIGILASGSVPDSRYRWHGFTCIFQLYGFHGEN
jgi:hypothetical protein